MWEKRFFKFEIWCQDQDWSDKGENKKATNRVTVTLCQEPKATLDLLLQENHSHQNANYNSWWRRRWWWRRWWWWRRCWWWWRPDGGWAAAEVEGELKEGVPEKQSHPVAASWGHHHEAWSWIMLSNPPLAPRWISEMPTLRLPTVGNSEVGMSELTHHQKCLPQLYCIFLLFFSYFYGLLV